MNKEKNFDEWLKEKVTKIKEKKEENR